VRNARVDIVIFGGGVAGLWTRHALHAAGYSTLLLSTSDLGDGQSVLSQGILHSGVKYALGAHAAEASRQLMDVQPVWEAALSGRSGPDLTRVRILAERMHMWSLPSTLARLTAVIGAKMLRSGTRALERGEYPDAFRDAPRGLQLWEVQERAIDATSLMEQLAGACPDPMIRCSTSARVEPAHDAVVVTGSDRFSRPFRVEASRVVFAAGIGNAGLLSSVGVDPVDVCQVRPLHMLSASGASAAIYGHCVQELSDKPRLTVTTSRGAAGELVWYLGGGPAETGVGQPPDAQFAVGRAELESCLPWLDHTRLTWRSIKVDRAEGRTPDGRRPDAPVVRRFGCTIAVWPTKLALAPTAARMVLESIAPLARRSDTRTDELRDTDAPVAATPPWAGGAA
jgi:glycine/D-amino acid oxidase-like deaminating enzyme